MKRLIGGIIVALVGALNMMVALGNLNGPDAIRALLVHAVMVLCGPLVAYAGFQSRSRKQSVRLAIAALASQNRSVDVSSLAESAGISEPLARYYLSTLDPQLASSLPPPVRVDKNQDAPWRRAFSKVASQLEMLDFLLDGNLEAVDIVQPKRSGCFVILLVPVVFILLLPGIILAALLVFPGLAFVAWRFASRWDWFEANQIKPPWLSFVVAFLIPIAASGALISMLFRPAFWTLALVRGELFLIRSRANDVLLTPFHLDDAAIQRVTVEVIAENLPSKTVYQVTTPDGKTRLFWARRNFMVKSEPDLTENLARLRV